MKWLDNNKQLQKICSSKRTNQRQSVEARNFVDVLNFCQQKRQRMQFVQRPGTIQEGNLKKRSRTDINEIKIDQSTSKVTLVNDEFFGTSFSTENCVCSDFFMGAGIARRFDQIYLQMKTEASRALTLGSVEAFYDQYWRKWIYYFGNQSQILSQNFYNALKNSLTMMRNNVEAHGLKIIQLPELGCGLDKLQQSIVHQVLHEVFQESVVWKQALSDVSPRWIGTAKQTRTKKNWEPPKKGDNELER